MEYFLDTEKTIEKGLGFALFGQVHITWLAICVLALVLGCVHYSRLSAHGREVWRKSIALLLVADEVFKLICLDIGNTFTLNYLPLHLCNINIFLIAVHAWQPNRLLGNFLYTVCIPATVAALLFPSWEKLPVLNFMHLHSFTVHILLAMYPIVLTVGGDIKPQARDIPKCLCLLAALATGVYCVNMALGTNFFYLMRAPKGNPLYWFHKAWGDHRLGFPILIAAVLAVMHAPMALWSRIHRHKGKKYLHL